LGIKASLRNVRRTSTPRARTVPLKLVRPRRRTFAPSGSLGVAKKLNEREMLHEPPMVQVAVFGLALLCVVVLFVAARSP
jgi:hypothetical protein